MKQILILACTILLSCACSSNPHIKKASKTTKKTSSLIKKVIPKKPIIQILFAGDTHFSWRIAKMQAAHGLHYPVTKVRPLFNHADYRILNLETTLTLRKSPFLNKAYIFAANPDNVQLLSYLGVNTVIMGNNHSMDMGPVGLQDTLATLRKTGISAVGAGINHQQSISPLIIKLHGLKFGILSYSMVGEQITFSSTSKSGVAKPNRHTIKSKIKKLQKSVDFVIVSIHWGIEYYTKPMSSQIKIAHKMVDAGASAIIGHHPHIPQGLEIYHGAIIAYSLGNFMFGSVNERQDHNYIIRLNFAKKEKLLSSVMINPIFGKYREDKAESIRPLTAPESRDFWKQMLVMTAKLSPTTSARIRVKNTGAGYLNMIRTTQ